MEVGSFMNTDKSFIYAVGSFVETEKELLFLTSVTLYLVGFEFDSAYLFVLWRSSYEDSFYIFFDIGSNIN